MRSNVIADRWLPLDGILFYQAHRHALGPEPLTKPGGASKPHRNITVPLKCINPGTEDWYYACSWARPQPWWVAEGRDAWVKRFDSRLSDIVDFQGRRGKVIIEEGTYKAYHMPIYYRSALRIEWYCVGDKVGIKHLLERMTHIGKKSAQGWGRVAKWDVVSWPHDWSCSGPNGEYMRGLLEVDPQRPGNFIQYGIRPSYYKRENQRVVVV